MNQQNYELKYELLVVVHNFAADCFEFMNALKETQSHHQHMMTTNLTKP